MNIKRTLFFTGLIVVFSALVSTSYYFSQHKIAKNEQHFLEKVIYQVIPRDNYKPDVLTTRTEIRDKQYFASDKPIGLYTAYVRGTVAFVVFDVTTPHGYSGDIRLLIGVTAKQQVRAVRVLTHQETPGLGDKLTLDKSDWINSFTDTSLENPVEAKWTIKPEGGVFDAWTGASITPRAVTLAIKETLRYTRMNYKDLFDTDDNDT